jgi:BirA family transcriptional regulator, biotin operon repressor / biotin---[acetyl-CoA-carboxylase] ligase
VNALLRMTHWEGHSVDHWCSMWGLPSLAIFEQLPSTNDDVRAAALDDAPAGTVIIAEQQTAGRGRMGRQWLAPSGSSLLLSLLVRPAPLDDSAPGTLPIRAGLAVARALRDIAAVDARVKWPNDVVVPRRGKLAGILCEAATAGTTGGFVVIGIGINIRQHADDWPAALRSSATSVDECSSVRTDRAVLAGSLLAQLQPLWTAPLAPLSGDEVDKYRELDALDGSVIAIHAGDAITHGTAAGIDTDGALLVRREHGVIERVTSATVRPASQTLLQRTP